MKMASGRFFEKILILSIAVLSSMVLPLLSSRADGASGLDDVMSGEGLYILLIIFVVAFAVMDVVLLIIFKKRAGYEDEMPQEFERREPPKSLPPITTIGDYCLTDGCIRFPSGKEIPYEQIDRVKLSRDYEPMILLTFGDAWQLTLRAGDQTNDLYEEIMIRMHRDEIITRLEKRRRKMIR